ncbi:MAG: hypothetical protein GVY27_10900 [Deinococcus-Thermus bacterium]|nr:hypothetical protein [Deinococcota bacterium]
MSWLDPAFAVLVGTLTAFGASRRLTGLWVGLGGVLLLRPLIGVAVSSPVVGLIAALLGGLLLGLLGRNLVAGLRAGRWWQRALGALGGAALGGALVLALAVSLPIQRSPFDPNQLYYPPRDLPALIQGSALRSWTLSLGRDVLLFPLLERQEAVPEGREALLRGLHRWLVVGEPWREGGAGS